MLGFIQSVSTWRGADERVILERCFYARAVDFLILASDHERARETLAFVVHRYTFGEQADQFNELELLRLSRLCRT